MSTSILNFDSPEALHNAGYGLSAYDLHEDRHLFRIGLDDYMANSEDCTSFDKFDVIINGDSLGLHGLKAVKIEDIMKLKNLHKRVNQ